MRGDPQDFLRRIDTTGDGCWLWTQSVTGSGYGMMPTGRNSFVAAHRYAYEHFVGPIPTGRHLHHVCEVRRCCNPEHLKPVTYREHAVEHGRGHTPDEYAAAIDLVVRFGVKEAARRTGISMGSLCANGAIGLSPKKWTREAVIASIQEFHRRYGTTPGAQDWNPAMARANGRHDLSDRYYEDGCWPPPTTLVRMFGTWNGAIKAAGFEPRAPGVRRNIQRAERVRLFCAGCGDPFSVTTTRRERRYCTRACYREHGLRLAPRGGVVAA